MIMFLEQRERAEEALFVRRQELAFEAHARRNKLFGLWVAQRAGLPDEAAERYASSVALEDFPHYRASAVLTRVASDLAGSGRAVAEQELAGALADSAARAQEDAWGGGSQRLSETAAVP
jgi:hypothetical protein